MNNKYNLTKLIGYTEVVDKQYERDLTLRYNKTLEYEGNLSIQHVGTVLDTVETAYDLQYMVKLRIKELLKEDPKGTLKQLKIDVDNKLKELKESE